VDPEGLRADQWAMRGTVTPARTISVARLGGATRTEAPAVRLPPSAWSMVRHVAYQSVVQDLAWSVTAFGSHVWGTPDSCSDVDLFVVANRSQVACLHRVFARVSMKIHRPVELTIESSCSVALALRDPASLASRVAVGGRLLAGGSLDSLVPHGVVADPDAARIADARWHLERADEQTGDLQTREVLAAAARLAGVPSYYAARRSWWSAAIAEGIGCSPDTVDWAVRGRHDGLLQHVRSLLS